MSVILSFAKEIVARAEREGSAFADNPLHSEPLYWLQLAKDYIQLQAFNAKAEIPIRLGVEAHDAFERYMAVHCPCGMEHNQQWEDLPRYVREGWNSAASWIAGRILRQFGQHPLRPARMPTDAEIADFARELNEPPPAEQPTPIVRIENLTPDPAAAEGIAKLLPEAAPLSVRDMETIQLLNPNAQTSWEAVLTEILGERLAQINKGYSAARDDKHGARMLLNSAAYLLASDVSIEVEEPLLPCVLECARKYSRRKCLIIGAALAVAGIEAEDRQE